MSITESRDTDTKPNTNRNRGKIPKPNRLGNIREMPTFYQSHSLFYSSEDSQYQQNTKCVSLETPNTKLVSVWYRYAKKLVFDWHL